MGVKLVRENGKAITEDQGMKAHYEPSPEELAKLARQASRALAQDLLLWAQWKEQIEGIEAKITEQILVLGESVTVGDVRAAYYKPGLCLDYQLGALANTELKGYKKALREATTTKESTAWAKLCQALGLEGDDIPSTERPARVVIRWA